MFRLAKGSRSAVSLAANAAPKVFRQTTRSTTILCVRKDGKVLMGGDGQVSQGSSVVKPNARKVRKIGDNIVVGFAGSTADAITLLERLEKKVEEHSNQLMRACVELAKDWRTDKFLRRLEATLIVADKDNTFEITGNGDVLEPHNDVMAVGSGGHFAQAAALALIDVPGYDAEKILRKAMKIAGDACVYTNHNLIIESVDAAPAASSEPVSGADASAQSSPVTGKKAKKEKD